MRFTSHFYNKNVFFLKIIADLFGYIKYISYLCTIKTTL
jgi:hypothetical protein